VPPADPDAPADDPAGDPAQPTVGPKIVGVARERTLPVVKKRLQEKPKREPLPWPELRAAVAAVRGDLDVTELKELFRLFPPKIRDEVTDNVRGFRKGARRPVSQHAAKQLARAVHTARRQKKNSHPSGEVAEALGQAMAAELIASLEPEVAAEVILPKRDLLERESRQARRRARDEEDRRRDEQRRRRREDAKSSRQQTSFGSFSGAKIQGLDEIAALFAQDEAVAPDPEAREAQSPPVSAAEPEAPAAAEPEQPTAEAEAPASEQIPPTETLAPEAVPAPEDEAAVPQQPPAPEDAAAAEAPGETASEPVPADEATGDRPDAPKTGDEPA
jgi:hypothetical protein